MDEKAVEKKLDDVFSDNRVNTMWLGMLTRRLFGLETEHRAAEWFHYHSLDVENKIKNHEPIDLSPFTRNFR